MMAQVFQVRLLKSEYCELIPLTLVISDISRMTDRCPNPALNNIVSPWLENSTD